MFVIISVLNNFTKENLLFWNTKATLTTAISNLLLTRSIVMTYIFISAAFLTQTVCLQDTTVKFEIWDTAGQERYHSLAPMYYRGAQAAIVVYDITNQVYWKYINNPHY